MEYQNKCQTPGCGKNKRYVFHERPVPKKMEKTVLEKEDFENYVTELSCTCSPPIYVTVRNLFNIIT